MFRLSKLFHRGICIYLIINDKTGKLQLEIFLINQKYDAEESMEEAEKLEKDKAWRFLWNNYRLRLIPDKKLLKKVIKVLGMNDEELEDILDWVHITDIEVDTNYWQEVLKNMVINMVNRKNI